MRSDCGLWFCTLMGDYALRGLKKKGITLTFQKYVTINGKRQ